VFRWPKLEGGHVRVRQDDLLKLVPGAPVATKLSGRLTPAEMKRDAYVRWVPYRAQGAKLYQTAAAVTWAGNVASIVLLFSALVAWFGYRLLARQTLPPSWFLKLTAVSLGIGAIVFLVTPQAAVGGVEVTRRLGPSAVKHLSLSVRLAIEDNNLEPSGDNLSRAVDELGLYFPSAYWGKARNPRQVPNPFTGERLRVEDSPGNIRFRSTTNGLDMIWYDFDGAPGFTNQVF
jgi:hypothetical protein